MPPRTPLLHPDEYFDRRRVSVGRALVVVSVLTVAVVAAVFGIGWVFTDRIDGTVAADNPARPPDAFCDGTFETDSMADRCDESATVERNVDYYVDRAIGDYAGQLLVATPFAWLLVGLLLHGGSWLAGGEGSAANSFVVAAWGLAPILASLTVGLAVLALTFDPITVSPSTPPGALEDRVFDALGPLETASTVLSLLTGLWGAVIWRFGLHHARGLSGTAASVVAGGVALLLFLLGG